MKISRKKRTIPYNFPQWLKATRKKCNLTQENLADFLECSVSTIQKYEAGSRTPDFEVYDRAVKIFTNILAGTEIIRNLIKDLDAAVIEGAGGDDKGIRQFWENLTNAFFADELKDYLIRGFLDDVMEYPMVLPDQQAICKRLNETFFDGESLIVPSSEESFRCTDAISAATKLYELPYDKLPNNNSPEYLFAYAWAKTTVFLALAKYIPENDPESVVYYTYKVFSPLRRELIKVFEAALVETTDTRNGYDNIIQANDPELPPTAYVYHAIGEHIAKGYCHEAPRFQ